MSQDFDKIFKENIAALLIPLAKKLLGIDIIHSEEMKDKLQTTIEREPDYLSLIETNEGKKYLLQLEFQTSNDDKMLLRMQEYYSILRKQYNYPIIQKVIYLGQKQATMRSKLSPEEVYTGFDLITINQEPYEKFLQSNIPEEFILSILADMHGVDPKEIVDSILHKLQETLKSQITFQKYVKQLVVLSRLRKLSEITKTSVKKMPIEYDVKEDAFYKEGVEDGKEVERRRIEEEKKMEKKNLIIKLIKSEKHSLHEIAEIMDVKVSYVQEISEKI